MKVPSTLDPVKLTYEAARGIVESSKLPLVEPEPMAQAKDELWLIEALKLMVLEPSELWGQVNVPEAIVIVEAKPIANLLDWLSTDVPFNVTFDVVFMSENEYPLLEVNCKVHLILDELLDISVELMVCSVKVNLPV